MIQSDTGKSSSVVPMLKIVCTVLISVCVIIPAPIPGLSTLKKKIAATLNMIVPITLNKRCMIAAVFAVFFAPILDMIAVTHVPIYCPMIIYTAALNGTSPAAARLCKMPTDADELWMIAVTSAPARIPRNGLCPSFTKMLQNASDS